MSRHFPGMYDNEDVGYDYGPEDEDSEMLEELGLNFADPGGRSALRAASYANPRNLPCPTCHRENVLTPADVELGYQCDKCADEMERGY